MAAKLALRGARNAASWRPPVTELAVPPGKLDLLRTRNSLRPGLLLRPLSSVTPTLGVSLA